MPTLNIKPTHKAITTYYDALDRYRQHGVTHETAVRAAFQALLEVGARQLNWTLVCEYTLRIPEGSRGTGPRTTVIRLDGALLDEHSLPCGTWEAKGVKGNLHAEVQKKFDVGYPQENILFQTPERAILYQNGSEVMDADITAPETLVTVLKAFFAYERAHAAQWHAAVARFKDIVPELGTEAAELIKTQHRTNAQFRADFAAFHQLCQAAINPNLSEAAVEEMLVQHLLTERIFRTVFEDPGFAQRNVIAREIENVLRGPLAKAYNRGTFLQRLSPFYREIEREAATLVDFSQKQHFLNTVYEQFFQGFSVKKADTHGIVYTPQPIVDFMVKSVAHVLKTEFNRSLSDEGVHLIDPFVGTGNFIVRLMREINPFHLKAKYRDELWCNEVLLLPYYVANLNIEHEFYAITDEYLPFEGISLVDTFELAEDRQLSLLTEENTARVAKQKASPMFVVIGNPPYNAGQVNENDNNKNRKYAAMDKRVEETYVKGSRATLRKALYDPYVKSLRWASDRIGKEGIVALVTNNSFIAGIAFDQMRHQLSADFDDIYVLDLGGNARTDTLVSDASVFGIQVGVSINIFVKNPSRRDLPVSTARIFYYRTDDAWNKHQKFEFLESTEHIGNVPWQTLEPDARHTWLTEGLNSEFLTFLPMGSKAAKRMKGEAEGVIFHTYSNGTVTGRDAWVYNFNRQTLTENVQHLINAYNSEVQRWRGVEDKTAHNVDDFVGADDKKIKWSRDLKAKLKRGRLAEYAEDKVREGLYRPFTKTNLFLDRVLNDFVGGFPAIFPTLDAEAENRVICVPGVGGRAPFWCCMTNVIPNTALITLDANQCFPFYIYDEDGTNRRENITDWAVENFRAHYGDDSIGKWEIFHYTYGLLHHPDYRERYAADLKRDLPHIPFAEDFWAFADAGAQLAELHVNYEKQPQYPLDFISKPDVPFNLLVEKMRLSTDKTQLKYNESLTLAGIPAKALEYRLGKRSALEWLIDQYRVKVDKNRSEIVNDANDVENPRYIVELIGSVITVSLETVKVVEGLPPLTQLAEAAG